MNYYFLFLLCFSVQAMDELPPAYEASGSSQQPSLISYQKLQNEAERTRNWNALTQSSNTLPALIRLHNDTELLIHLTLKDNSPLINILPCNRQSVCDTTILTNEGNPTKICVLEFTDEQGNKKSSSPTEVDIKKDNLNFIRWWKNSDETFLFDKVNLPLHLLGKLVINSRINHEQNQIACKLSIIQNNGQDEYIIQEKTIETMKNCFYSMRCNQSEKTIRLCLTDQQGSTTYEFPAIENFSANHSRVIRIQKTNNAGISTYVFKDTVIPPVTHQVS